MKCRELMTLEPEWISSAATALDAAQVMRDRSTSLLLISDPTPRRLRAIVTDRDLAVRVCAENEPPGSTPVLEIATVPVAMCNGDDELHVAEKQMRDTGRSRLVVVDDDGEVRGVLSLVDILRQGSLDRASYGQAHPRQLDQIELTPSTPADEDAAARQSSVMMGATRSDSMKMFPT